MTHVFPLSRETHAPVYPHTVRTLRLQVKPNSRTEELAPQDDGSFIARVKAPPVDGKANAAVINLIAKHFGIRKAQVVIKSGASARMKLVQILD